MKFIPCDEDSQTYSFTRTTKKSRQRDYNVNESKFKNDGFKKLKKAKKY